MLYLAQFFTNPPENPEGDRSYGKDLKAFLFQNAVVWDSSPFLQVLVLPWEGPTVQRGTRNRFKTKYLLYKNSLDWRQDLFQKRAAKK